MTLIEKIKRWDAEYGPYGKCLHINWKKRKCWIMDIYPDGVRAYGPYCIDDDGVMDSFVFW